MGFSGKLMGLMLLIVLFVPLYSWVVQVVNGSPPQGIIKSFSLKGDGETGFSGAVRVGGALLAIAESDLASAYRLEIYLNSSLVFSEQGQFVNGNASVRLALNPPTFDGGGTYLLVLNAYALNRPIPGAYFSDSAVSMFSVITSETKLGLTTEYDGLFGTLHLRAKLTCAESSLPVANETVSFSLQRAHTGRLTEGWLPLGTTITDSNGTTQLDLAFGLPDGNYFVKGVHKANENFGSSENKTEVTALFRPAFEGVSYVPRSSGYVYSPLSGGSLTLATSSVTPYARLAMNATVRYVTDTPLQGGFSVFIFYLDATSGAFASSPATRVASSPYVYEAPLVWSPNVTSVHRLIAGIFSGDIGDLYLAYINGTGLIATDDVVLDIQRCPSNIEFSYPKAVYGSALPVSVAVSMPSLYEASSSEFYNLTTLGSRLLYNSAEYVFAEGVESASVGLYLNDSWVDGKTSGQDGVVDFQLNMNFKTARVKAVFDGGSLFAAASAEEVVAFNRIRVYDRTDTTNANFRFNFTVNGVLDPTSIYVGFENRLEAEASLLNQSVQNLPMNVIYARHLQSSTTDSSGRTSVPGSADYLWVPGTTSFVGDLNGDGKTDTRDLAITAKAFGSRPGDSNWNVDADVNHDNIVDIKDHATIAKYYGKSDDRVVFNNGVEVYLDNKGFGRIPSGATSLTLYKTTSNGAPTPNNSVAFFDVALNETSSTDSLGRFDETWIPTEEQIGRYVIQFKSLNKFDVSTTSSTTITGLDAQANVFKFVDVKRPIDLNVTNTPSQPIIDDWVTTSVRAYDFGQSSPMAGYSIEFYAWNYLNNSFVYMGSSVTNSSGIAIFGWTPRYYVDHGFSSGFLLLSARIVDGERNVLAEKTPVQVDARYPTHLEYVMGGDVINVNVGQTYELAVKLVRNDTNQPVYGQRIDFYRNGSFVSWANTSSSGIAYTDWTVERRETFYHKAVMLDRDPVFGAYRPSNEAWLMAVAVSVPTTIDFDVEPRDFVPGALLTLNATVRNALSGALMNNFLVSFYKVGQSGTKTLLGNTTTTNGIALMSYHYSSGPYAFMAEAASGGTVISSSGIMLTASFPTTLTLNVTKDNVSYKHTLSGTLKTGDSGMVGSVIRILVNDTDAQHVTTTSGGQFAATLTLKPLNGTLVTYRISAVFDGYGVYNASAYDSSPDGQKYAVSTTMDYGFKPASDSASLTVGPQATLAAMAAKTMEQMQQEAQSSGFVKRPEPWFSLWFPWFRLHYIGEYEGETLIDIGLAALPLADSISIPVSPIWQEVDQFFLKIAFNVAVGIGAIEAALWALSNIGPIAFLLVLASYFAYKFYSLHVLNWKSVDSLQISLVSTILSILISIWTGIPVLIPFLLIVPIAGAAAVRSLPYGFLCKLFMIPINMWLLITTVARLDSLGAI